MLIGSVTNNAPIKFHVSSRREFCTLDVRSSLQELGLGIMGVYHMTYTCMLWYHGYISNDPPPPEIECVIEVTVLCVERTKSPQEPRYGIGGVHEHMYKVLGVHLACLSTYLQTNYVPTSPCRAYPCVLEHAIGKIQHLRHSDHLFRGLLQRFL